MGEFVVSVDVGTGSARAGVFDRKGSLIARAAHPIAMRREDAVTAEHNSEDIWAAVCRSVRRAVMDAAIEPNKIDAIGFDATCSLTFLDPQHNQVSVARDGEAGWDTIAWLDHRAIAEAGALSASGAEAVRYSGDIISPEMQLPKIMWVRDHLPAAWAETSVILDLADYLTFRASGSLTRSACTLTPKWNYLNHASQGWDEVLLARAGLKDLTAKAGITGRPAAPGTDVGGLSAVTAEELGLREGIKVATGMVDAYAGALALAGADPDASDTVSLVGGTSSCVMRFSRRANFLQPFWGPYFGVALPDAWMIEGGQSAAGALLDLILRMHLGHDPNAEDHERVLAHIAGQLKVHGPAFGGDIHILPDFHGNRTPYGDAGMRGSLYGLSLDSSFDGVAALYYRAMVSLALGIRQIVERMEEAGGTIRTLHLGGGHAKNPLFIRLYADATNRNVVISSGEEAMLLGTAMTAAAAAGWHESLAAACKAMARPGHRVAPDTSTTAMFERDYRIFLTMQDHRRVLAEM
jgi:FGGY-family pentulose kinase